MGSKHLLGSSGGDEAGRLMLTGAPTWGTHILYFFAHLPYTETSVYIIVLKQLWLQNIWLVWKSVTLCTDLCSRGDKNKYSCWLHLCRSLHSHSRCLHSRQCWFGKWGPQSPVDMYNCDNIHTHYVIMPSSLWGKQYLNPLLHWFKSLSSSPVFSLLLLIHLAGSSIGTWVIHTGIQCCLTVLALRQRTEIMYIFWYK